MTNFVGLPSGTTVLGNFIGVDATGLRAIPNNGNGVFLNASGVQVGGTGQGQANTIANSGANGVQVGPHLRRGQGFLPLTDAYFLHNGDPSFEHVVSVVIVNSVHVTQIVPLITLA